MLTDALRLRVPPPSPARRTGDFGFGRFCQMMWRLNFLVFFLCVILKVGKRGRLREGARGWRAGSFSGCEPPPHPHPTP
jgi:hypothetical protein